MASADAPVPRCTCDVRNLATCSTVNQDIPTSRVVRSYRPHGSLARLLYDKQKADEQLEAYDKTQWYKIDRTKIREDLLRLWIPLGAGLHHDQPDKTAEIFLMKSIERSDSLPLQAWHSLARSALSWFISRTSINGLLGRGSMHVFSCEQFQKLMVASGFLGPWHSLVDLGAGDGATTAHVAHLFEKVYATDISAPMRWTLAKRKFTVLDVEKWYENSPFNVILCLNLLDRCDRPNTLLRRLKSSLAPGGRLVVALVLPFSPYVEVGERDDHKPSEYLPVKGNGLEGQIASLVDRVFAPLSLRCLAWSKLPYLCEGDLGQAYYFLDDVIFVLEAQPDSSRYSASEWMDIEPFERKCCNIFEQQSGNERNSAVIPIMKVEKNIPKSVNMASRYNHAIQRVLAKLEASINSENYYEAHQMYRTLYFRYLGQKKYSELLELLYNGSTLLLQHEQHASGADLGILFVNVLTQSGTEPSQDYFEKITNLFSIMSPLSPERDVFVQSALRWSIKNTDYKIGHPDLHQKIAQVFWREKNYVMARQHFIYSRDGSGCAAMLVELHEQRGYKNEIDLFIAQAVLQYLCLQNKTTAQEVFNSYTSQHPKINRGPPYLLPLLNFLFFLLKIVDSGKLTVFTVLCEQYRISLNRDPCYRQYLDKIGQLFFNVPSPRPRNQGLFGTLLQSFFNGLEDEGSDDEQRNIASTSQTAQELD